MSVSNVPMFPSTPYIGPRPFENGMALYGRDKDLRRLFHSLISERILLMYSPSGAGKTSLIQAGLLPALQNPTSDVGKISKQFQVLPPVRVGHEIHPKLKVANRYLWSLQFSLTKQVDESKVVTLEQALAAFIKKDSSHGNYRVLVFDQFEEILTTSRTDLNAKEEFFQKLGGLLEDPSLLALFSMREEYLAGLDPFARAIPNRFQSRFRLDYLSATQAEDAIIKPLPQGFDFEAEALSLILNDLRELPMRERDSQPRLSDTIEPFQLQVVCTRLWESAGSKSGKITASDVKTHGNIKTALGDYYAEKIREIAPKTAPQISERELREWVQTKLISPNRYRSRILVEPADVADGPTLPVIRSLVSAWLLTEDSRADGSSQFELSHDRLIEPVLANNQQWFSLHCPPFAGRANTWHTTGRPVQLLLRSVDLAEAEHWCEQNVFETLSKDERDYLNRSRELRDVRRQQSAAARAAEQRTNLEDLGWGVIVPHDVDPRILAALRPLLDHRHAQATKKNERLYKEFIGERAHRPGMSYYDFLVRQGVQLGPPDFAKVPYYLLIVGSPRQIPFDFQYGLDIAYAAGRLYFDTPEEYARYAEAVVEYESKPSRTYCKRVTAIFSPKHRDDNATKTLHEQLAIPLADAAERAAGETWGIERVFNPEATKEKLLSLLGGSATPNFLITATHGISWPMEDSRQPLEQGALLCQEWDGRGRKITPEMYLTAADIPDSANLSGLVAFLFSAHSAGTPQHDDFPREVFERPEQIAAEPFISRLPLRLLGHPNGSALAVIGHVERTWGTSITSEADTRVGEIVHFTSCLKRIQRGHTIGSAMELFNLRYARAAQRLSEDFLKFGGPEASDLQREDLRALIIRTTDARNYVILGDPAVRIKVSRKRGSKVNRAKRKLVFNGIDGASGRYLLNSVTLEEAADVILQANQEAMNRLNEG